MSEAQKLQQEIDALSAKRNATKAASTVKDEWPAPKRGGFTYRNSPAIKATDITSL